MRKRRRKVIQNMRRRAFRVRYRIYEYTISVANPKAVAIGIIK